MYHQVKHKTEILTKRKQSVFVKVNKSMMQEKIVF